jgi:hypothetical protein
MQSKTIDMIYTLLIFGNVKLLTAVAALAVVLSIMSKVNKMFRVSGLFFSRYFA